jgi:hypothetical protein
MYLLQYLFPFLAYIDATSAREPEFFERKGNSDDMGQRDAVVQDDRQTGGNILFYFIL